MAAERDLRSRTDTFAEYRRVSTYKGAHLLYKRPARRSFAREKRENTVLKRVPGACSTRSIEMERIEAGVRRDAGERSRNRRSDYAPAIVPGVNYEPGRALMTESREGN